MPNLLNSIGTRNAMLWVEDEDPDLIVSSIGGDEVESSVVIATGSGYTTASATITGDGTGATASVDLDAGQVIGITITNKGSGYTQASISISGDGAGAMAVAYVGLRAIQDYASMELDADSRALRRVGYQDQCESSRGPGNRKGNARTAY